MEKLFELCLFREEGTCVSERSKVIDMSKINSYVERGKANLLQTNLPHVVSVDVRESDQLDVKHLFCGARSLLIDERSGQIVARGVNKFRDYAEIDTLLINSNSNSNNNNNTKHNLYLYDIFSQQSLWEQCQVWALRKMAGFIVTLFALDANELHVMSKHATDGPHVQIAKRILNSLLSTSEQKVIAHDLFTHGASVCCECVAPVDDDQHPVMEDDTFHDQLVIFAIQQAHEVMELSLPYAEVMAWANKWKLLCAPSQRLHSLLDLWSLVCAVRRWDANLAEVQKENLSFHVVCSYNNSHNERDDPNRTTNREDHSLRNLTKNSNTALTTHFAEGVVLVLETNLQVDSSSTWKRPIRVKIKTPCYIALRSLRSLLSGDSHPRIMLFHAIMTQWAKQRRAVLQLQDQEMKLTTKKEQEKSLTRSEYSRCAIKYEAPHQSTESFQKEEQEEYNKENEHSVSSWGWLQSLVAEHGIWWLYKQFVCDMMLSSERTHQRRWQNATDTVGSAFMKLIRFSEATLNTTFNSCPLTVIVMCGLPGSGKSTLSAKLLECAELAEHFDFAILLSRDDITKHVKTKNNITESSSKHKQRRVGKLVHYATRAALNSVIEYTHILHVRDDSHNARLTCNYNHKFDQGDTNYITDNSNNVTQIEKRNKPGLLIYDACNATRSTRRAWRKLLPQKLINYTLIYLSCDESTSLTLQANLATNAQNNNINSMNTTRSNFCFDACTSQELHYESKIETNLSEPNTTACHRTLCSKNKKVESLQILLSRMNTRANHSVITDSNVAQRALYNVWRKFEPPECDNELLVELEQEEENEQTLEKCLHFDTRHTSVEKIAHEVCTHVIGSSFHLPHTSLSTNICTNTHARLLKVWDIQEIANMVEEWKRNLICNLLGDSDALVNDTMNLLTNATTSWSSSLSLQKWKRSNTWNENKAIVAVQLEISQEEIWHIVSLLLSHVLQTEFPEFTLASGCEQKLESCQKETQETEEQHETQTITTTATRKRGRTAAMFTSPSNWLSLLRRCRTFVYSAAPWRVLPRRLWSVRESKEEQNTSSTYLLKSDADANTFACSLIAGHDRWLRGWLLHSNTTELTRHTSESDLPCKKRICKEKVSMKEEEEEEHKVANTCHHSQSDYHCENAFYNKKNGSGATNINIHNDNSDEDNTTKPLEEKIVDALHDRFPVEPKNLHVTLLHEELSTLLREQPGETNKEWQRRNNHNNISSDKRDAMCNQVVELENKIGLPCGARVRVSLNELLIDRFAICFGVTLPDHDERRLQWGTSELYEQTTENRLDQNITTMSSAAVNHTNKVVGNDKSAMTRIPLHMTVATSPRVKAQYCGQLFDLCDQYEKENVELAYSKSIAGDGAVVRSRLKFHNFIRLRLSKPLYLSGKIVHDIHEPLSRL